MEFYDRNAMRDIEGTFDWRVHWKKYRDWYAVIFSNPTNSEAYECLTQSSD